LRSSTIGGRLPLRVMIFISSNCYFGLCFTFEEDPMRYSISYILRSSSIGGLLPMEVISRPPQSEFWPARRKCLSKCACQNAGNARNLCFSLFIYIMLAKMNVISFQLLKMVNLGPSSGT
jgi:hypothetical protein